MPRSRFLGILSLCVLAITSATLVMYSQEAGDAGKPAAEADANTLPATRTITDLKGRSMAGVIVSKTDTAIKFRRAADAKEFEIDLDTLSDADRTFVEGRTNAPIKKPKVLVVIHHKTLTTLLEASGMETHSIDAQELG